jgi:hypothetical protein
MKLISIDDWTEMAIKRYEEHRTQAAYSHLKSVPPDDSINMMWHGWALREAFEAGAKWQVKTEMGHGQPIDDYGYNDE